MLLSTLLSPVLRVWYFHNLFFFIIYCTPIVYGEECSQVTLNVIRKCNKGTQCKYRWPDALVSITAPRHSFYCPQLHEKITVSPFFVTKCEILTQISSCTLHQITHLQFLYNYLNIGNDLQATHPYSMIDESVPLLMCWYVHIVASELNDPICHSNECQIGSFSSEATIVHVVYITTCTSVTYAASISKFTH